MYLSTLTFDFHRNMDDPVALGENTVYGSLESFGSAARWCSDECKSKPAHGFTIQYSAATKLVATAEVVTPHLQHPQYVGDHLNV